MTVPGDVGVAARRDDAAGGESVTRAAETVTTIDASTTGAVARGSRVDGESGALARGGTSTGSAGIDASTRTLVRVAAVVAVGDEAAVRAILATSLGTASDDAIEEVLLQSYLFAGFPRALNAMRVWRKVSGRPAPAADVDAALTPDDWRARGERTCAAVYGPFYTRLRHNIAGLHPALDAWMIDEGYGKVLGRPPLDLATRELCVIAVCAVARQERQLHSHLHGALHVGASPLAVRGALDAIDDLLGADAHADALRLWSHVLATNAATRPLRA